MSAGRASEEDAFDDPLEEFGEAPSEPGTQASSSVTASAFALLGNVGSMLKGPPKITNVAPMLGAREQEAYDSDVDQAVREIFLNRFAHAEQMVQAKAAVDPLYSLAYAAMSFMVTFPRYLLGLADVCRGQP